MFLDNSINWNDGTPARHIININKKYNAKNNFAGSICHCISVDFMIKYLIQNNVKDLILVDSDVLFKQNPLNVINHDYVSIGQYNYDYKRIDPCFIYFNLDKIKEYRLNYFDETRMLGISTENYKEYDTGSSFTEDIIKNNYKYFDIKYTDYVEHFVGGSYIFNAADLPKWHNIKKEDQPQYTYNLVYKWLSEHSSLYL